MMTGKQKVFFTLLVCLTSVVILIMAGCTEPAAPTTTAPTTSTPTTSQPEPEETFELKWLLTNTGYTEGRWAWEACMGDGWAGEVTYLTDGRVTFDYMIGAVTPPDMYDSLVNGTGDIANNVILINTGRFPGLEIMSIRPLFLECYRPSQIANQLYQTFPEIQNEFDEVKMISVYASTPTPPGIGFATIDEPIDTMEKAKGVKMGQYGLWSTKRTDAIGFTSVAVPNPEVYEALQRGIVDGSFMDSDFLTNQNVGELVHYWHSVGMLDCPFYFGMNWDTWNSLPPDIQKIMDDVAVNIPDWADRFLQNDKEEVIAEWPDLIYVEFTEEEQQRWRDAVAPIDQEYVEYLNGKGYPGQAIYDEMQRLYSSGDYKDMLSMDEVAPRHTQ